jgi:sodium/potassium-transporting ATPase subunit alpha
MFIKMIAFIACFVGIVFFCLGFALGYGYVSNLVFAIGILVANVPEGLLTTVTIGLSLTARKLALRKVLVKNLESVETLGSTYFINH